MSCEINWQMQTSNFEIPCQTLTEINFNLFSPNRSFGWNFEGKSRGSNQKKVGNRTLIWNAP